MTVDAQLFLAAAQETTLHFTASIKTVSQLRQGLDQAVKENPEGDDKTMPSWESPGMGKVSPLFTTVLPACLH